MKAKITKIIKLLQILVVFYLLKISCKEKIQKYEYDYKIQKGELKMKDGIKLSVTYYFPINDKKEFLSNDNKFPAILKVDPYRKEDMFYSADNDMLAYFAKNGYVSVKVDIRGTGSSDGIVPDREYSENELEDIMEVIEIISNMPWCNTNVGMIGKSWSAFNSIMIASRKPKPLKGFVALHGSQDLFFRDVHYLDGVMHLDTFPILMDNDNALPKSPKYEINQEYFENRFDKEPWIFNYMTQQLDSNFWRKESLLYKDPLEVPSYVIGGLKDMYRDFAPYIFQNSKAKVKMDIGPYAHEYPHKSDNSHNYEWRKLSVKWFDKWLKDSSTNNINSTDQNEKENDDPLVTIFVRDISDCSNQIKFKDIEKGTNNGKKKLGKFIPGYWRAENAYPIPGTKYVKFYTSKDKSLIINDSINENESISDYLNINKSKDGHNLVYKAGLGMSSIPFSLTNNSKTQCLTKNNFEKVNEEELNSLIYDYIVKDSNIEIIGMPEVNLEIKADVKLFYFYVKLESVSPSGEISFVSDCFINPIFREGRENPKFMTPNEIVNLKCNIHFTTWTFRIGHKIRLSISNSKFPLAWPTPYQGSMTLYPGINSWIVLPITPKSLNPEPKLPEPEEIDNGEYYKKIYSYDLTCNYSRDEYTQNSAQYCSEEDSFKVKNNNFHTTNYYNWEVNSHSPEKSYFTAFRRTLFEINDDESKSINLYTKMNVESDEKYYHVEVERTLNVNGKEIRTKLWKKSIPILQIDE